MASLLFALLVFFAIPLYKELDKIMTKGNDKNEGPDSNDLF